MSAAEALPTEMPDEDAERLEQPMAAEHRAMLAELYQFAVANTHARRAKPDRSSDEETVNLALAGKLGGDMQRIVEGRIDNFRRQVQLFPDEAKTRDPEAYWRLVVGSVRAIRRAKAVERGELSAGFLRMLRRRVEAKMRGEIAERVNDEFDGMFDDYDPTAERYG